MIDLYGGEVSFVGEILYGKILFFCYDGKGVYVGLVQDLLVICYYFFVGIYVIFLKCFQVIFWIVN